MELWTLEESGATCDDVGIDKQDDQAMDSTFRGPCGITFDLEERLTLTLSKYLTNEKSTGKDTLNEHVDRYVESPRRESRKSRKIHIEELRSMLDFLHIIVSGEEAKLESNHAAVVIKVMDLLIGKIERHEMVIRAMKSDNTKMRQTIDKTAQRIDHLEQNSRALSEDEHILTRSGSGYEGQPWLMPSTPRLARQSSLSSTSSSTTQLGAGPIDVRHLSRESSPALNSSRYLPRDSPASSPSLGASTPHYTHISHHDQQLCPYCPDLLNSSFEGLMLHSSTESTSYRSSLGISSTSSTSSSGGYMVDPGASSVSQQQHHHPPTSDNLSSNGDDFWRNEVIESIRKQKQRESREREKRHRRKQNKYRHSTPLSPMSSPLVKSSSSSSSSSAPTRTSSFHEYLLDRNRIRSNSDGVPVIQRNRLSRQQSISSLQLSQTTFK